MIKSYLLRRYSKKFLLEKRKAVLESYRDTFLAIGLPLYVLFSVLDHLYGMFWAFFPIRIFVAFCSTLFLIQPFSYLAKKYFVFFPIFITSVWNVSICFMILQLGGVESSYFAGLILVVQGMSTGLNLGPLQSIFNAIVCVSMYTITIVFFDTNYNNNALLLMKHLFFLSSPIVLNALAGNNNVFYLEKIQKLLLKVRKESFNKELQIKKQAKTLYRQKALQMQFSPQIARLVVDKGIEIDGIQTNRDITTVVIDIESSTKKYSQIGMYNCNKVIAESFKLMTDTLLSFDLTVEKFTGDGVMAFSNAPIAESKHVEKAILASIKVMDVINQNRSKLEAIWNGHFGIRIGIHTGLASVGFIGTGEMRFYTALGLDVSLAHRVCSACSSDQILVTDRVIKELGKNSSIFTCLSIGQKKLKGLVERVTLYEVLAISELPEVDSCSKCGKLKRYVQIRGTHQMKCPSCFNNYFFNS